MRHYAKCFTVPLFALSRLAFLLFGNSLVNAQSMVGTSILTVAQKAQAAEVAQSAEEINQSSTFWRVLAR